MKNQLNATAAALSLGVLWPLSILVLTIISLQSGYANEFMGLIADVYPGYEVSGKGAVIGMLYGFADGFVSTWLLVTFYNFFVRKLSK